jgi:hypothetical protein
MSFTETVEFAMVNLGHNQTKAVQFANEIQERKMEALYSMTEEETIEYAMTTLGFCKVEAELYAAHLEERKQEIQKVQDQASLLEPKDTDELLEWHGITGKDLFGKGATAQLFNKPDVATVMDASQAEVVDLSANSPEKKKKKGPAGALKTKNCYTTTTTAKFAITPTAYVYKNPCTFAEAAISLTSEDKPKKLIAAIKLLLKNEKYLDSNFGLTPLKNVEGTKPKIILTEDNVPLNFTHLGQYRGPQGGKSLSQRKSGRTTTNQNLTEMTLRQKTRTPRTI